MSTRKIIIESSHARARAGRNSPSSRTTALIASTCLMLVLPGSVLAETPVAGEHQVVRLLAPEWRFDASAPACGTLDAQHPEGVLGAAAADSFTVKFTFEPRGFDGEATILEIPDVLQVRLRQHDPADRKRQNYPAFRMPDGSVPVLEATVVLHSTEHPDWNKMTIGIPLAMLEEPAGSHEVVLHFSGPDWKMVVDGRMLDSDFPFGYPAWPEKGGWKINPGYVENAELHRPGITPAQAPAKTPRTSPGIQYWTPPGHNNWVGDVETLFHQGRYHVFYLYDRRHHQSKFGCGAHYFEHLSTADFRTWTEHEAATPLEEQWECIGTGVPFVNNGRLCLSYGMHTTRVYPKEQTTLPAQWEYLEKHGRSGTFQQDATPGIPAGSTYAVSADGVSNFKKSGIMFHPCENPSVYTDPEGRLRMLANFGASGTWESASLDGGWRCINPGFPPGGDCTIYFRWNRFDYIIGGFTGLWSKPAAAADTEYADVVARGLDFYDGLNVPAVAEIPGGRFLMAGWIPVGGWGGNLVIRELVQSADGRISSMWMPEILPQTGASVALADQLAGAATIPVDATSFLLEFDVHPAAAGTGKVGVSFLPEAGGRAACELAVRMDERRAQFAPGSAEGFAGRQKSLREGGSPHHAGDYAVENLTGTDRPFAVRIIVKSDTKTGGSLVDAEIAGQRTMITHRPGLHTRKIVFRIEDAELRNVRLAPLAQDRPASHGAP